MKMTALILTLLLLNIRGVYAQSPLQKLSKNSAACYGREYNDKHMKAHPKQSVKRMRVKLYPAEHDGNSLIMDVELGIKEVISQKGESPYEYIKPYRSSLYCHSVTDGNIKCSIDCDGGSATITWTKEQKDNGTITFDNNSFVIYGGCGEMDENGEPADSRYLLDLPGGDDIFKLVSLPQEFCQL